MGAATGHGLGEQNAYLGAPGPSRKLLSMARGGTFHESGTNQEQGTLSIVTRACGTLSTMGHTIGPRNAGQQIAGRALFAIRNAYGVRGTEVCWPGPLLLTQLSMPVSQ